MKYLVEYTIDADSSANVIGSIPVGSTINKIIALESEVSEPHSLADTTAELMKRASGELQNLAKRFTDEWKETFSKKN